MLLKCFAALLILGVFCASSKLTLNKQYSSADHKIVLTTYHPLALFGNNSDGRSKASIIIKVNAKVNVKHITTDTILMKLQFSDKQPCGKAKLKSAVINLNKSDPFIKSQIIEKAKENCFYGNGLIYYNRHNSSRETVYNLVENSWAALAVCKKSIEGYLLLENEGFIVETFAANDEHHRNRKSKRKHKRAVSELSKTSFFNLTGDTFDHDAANPAKVEFNQWPQFNSEKPEPVANLKMPPMPNTKDPTQSTHPLGTNNEGNRVFATVSLADMDLLESNFTKPSDSQTMSTSTSNRLLDQHDDEELGYFYDSAWKSVTAKSSYHHKHHRHGTTPQRYLEIVIGIDDSVIKFHGRQRVKQYVLTLMNIVSALYQDPSLEAKLQLVVKELYFYEKKRHVIRVGNAKKSLENVNLWNKDLHLNYAEEDEPHDIALWLTRVDIGGPSGYAPVGGVCDPDRSCALTRDEGLTCAFIIAHELAHILGLSHDGDPKNGNSCKDEALQGSVMAPMVSATFHHFLWSDCSRKEFALKVKQWQCLLNHPDVKKSIELNSTLGTKFTMDEQCRVEFGEGYMLCRSFDIVEPCAHLWCGHVNSPLVCKTKKGPPLEGTECGPQKWCIDGYCDSTLRINMDPLKFNPQDGGWSDWGTWNTCSRTCGGGVQFRTRECNNPRPAYGGNECAGLHEEWQVCNFYDCPERKDFRAQQCLKMPKLLDVPWNYTWLPYESKQDDLKCKYICQSKETGEIYASEEFLTDGTLCSYDYDNRICVQGQCVVIGCDHIVNSSVIQDGCGVCAGNGSQCTRIRSSFTKRIKKQITRLGVVHNQARHVAIEFDIHQDGNRSNRTPQIDFDLFLKDRQRNVHWIRKSIDRAENKWEFNLLTKKNNHLNDVLTEPDRLQEDQDAAQSGITVTIVHGAKFRFHTGGDSSGRNGHNGTKYLSTQGPILTELILFIEIKNLRNYFPINLKIDMEYVLHKKHKDSRYEWIIGGWGSCSKSCGGGKMFKTKACVEKMTQRIVPRKYCSIVNKPATEVQACNNFSFVWVPGDWEACSATCGSRGIQNREIYCIPQNLQNTTAGVTKSPWTWMLPPSKCGYQPPATTRACARTFCPGYWEFSEWSKCSTSCDYGVQIRKAKCNPNIYNLTNGRTKDIDTQLSYGTLPMVARDTLGFGNNLKIDEFSCGTDDKNAPKQYQLCTNNKNNCNLCPGDTSVLCGLHSLKRYCQIDSFRELCCHSCSLHRLTPIQI